MRLIKIILALIIIQFTVSCSSKKQPEPSLAGKWVVTSAVGNDDRHWNGSFTLTGDAGGYKGIFLWDAVDGKSTGTDNITGTYNAESRVLTMQSVVITGNIESVLYTMDVSADGKTMTGIWTGSSDGSVARPGRWSAKKQ